MADNDKSRGKLITPIQDQTAQSELRKDKTVLPELDPRLKINLTGSDPRLKVKLTGSDPKLNVKLTGSAPVSSRKGLPKLVSNKKNSASLTDLNSGGKDTTEQQTGYVTFTLHLLVFTSLHLFIPVFFHFSLINHHEKNVLGIT